MSDPAGFPPAKFRKELAPNFCRDIETIEDHEPSVVEHANHGARPDLTQALFSEAQKSRASDVHIEPRSDGCRIRFRVDGVIWDVLDLSERRARILVNQIKALADLDPVTRFTPRDAHATCHIYDQRLDLRVAIAPCVSGEAMSIRLMDPRRLDRPKDNLGLSQHGLDKLNGWMEDANGMFLAAGPTGSGKTSTIYSLLRELRYSDRTIVSLEDPVEYVIDGISQIQIDELHHLTFAEGAKSLHRMDPDILMLGEIRDAPSASASVQAAITGRVLLSTIHCRDAAGAISAMRNWDLADHEIAEALTVVVAQRLIRRLCADCKSEAKPNKADKAWLRSLNITPPKNGWVANGCDKCNGLGFLGRTGLFEFWRLDSSDYHLILGHASERELRARLREKRHESLAHAGVAKVNDGITSLSEVRRVTSGAYPNQEQATARRKIKRKASSAKLNPIRNPIR